MVGRALNHVSVFCFVFRGWQKKRMVSTWHRQTNVPGKQDFTCPLKKVAWCFRRPPALTILNTVLSCQIKACAAPSHKTFLWLLHADFLTDGRKFQSFRWQILVPAIQGQKSPDRIMQKLPQKSTELIAQVDRFESSHVDLNHLMFRSRRASSSLMIILHQKRTGQNAAALKAWNCWCTTWDMADKG